MHSNADYQAYTVALDSTQFPKRCPFCLQPNSAKPYLSKPQIAALSLKSPNYPGLALLMSRFEAPLQRQG
jgi:hypothetical protein